MNEPNIFADVIAPTLGAIGGSAVIVAAFAHFLGKIWMDRIAKSTAARFGAELEGIKAKNILALEEFRTKSSITLKQNDRFADISQEFYQSFFNKRVETYLKLLHIKNKYIKDMEEDFLTEELESWGGIYHSTYKAIRELVIENQLYISNDLDRIFGELRSEASIYTKEADLVEAYTYDPDNPPWENKHVVAVHQKFANKTNGKMKAVLEQIAADISKLRSRIEID